MSDEKIELTDRERAVIRAAKAEMADDFYKQVGRTVVNRLLVVIGAIAVGIAYGKGWIRF
jgi:hypothetical protein